MKTWKFIVLTFFFTTYSCGNFVDPVDNGDLLSYSITVLDPISGSRNINDALDIRISFISEGNQPVHNVSIEIFEEANQNEIIYSEPSNKNVFETDGVYEYNDILLLNPANGFKAGTDYSLRAKVWGPTEGAGEVERIVDFSINN